MNINNTTPEKVFGIEIKVLKCTDCSKVIDEHDYSDADGNAICETCYQDNYFTCENCENIKYNDDTNSVDGGDRIICNDCFSENYINCDDCGENVNHERSYNVYRRSREISICEGCLDNYTICYSCEEYHNDTSTGSDEEEYCNNCYSDRDEESTPSNRLINDYSFQPEYQFHKELGENTLYLGVELEVIVKESLSVNETASKFKAWLESNKLSEYLYFKEDGSVPHGFEIVSHPFTLKAFHKKMNWYKILAWLTANGCRSYVSGKCGLHVHVSKNELSQDSQRKIKLFIYSNKINIIKFSKRDENNMGYCSIELYPMDTYLADRNYQRVSQIQRHVAFNTNTGKRTCEFRLFRGTLGHKRFLASLQFSDALCYFIKTVSAVQIADAGSWTTFKQYLKRTAKYEQLRKYLDKHV